MSAYLLLDGVKVPCASPAVRDLLTEKVVTVSVAGSGAVAATVLVQTHNGDGVWQPGATITCSGSDSASGSATLSTTDAYQRAVVSLVSGTSAAVTASLETQSAAEKTAEIPVGGTVNQVLVKASATDGDVKWVEKAAVVALTDATSIATDASLGDVFTLTLAGDHTIAAPSNPVNGKRITYRITQGASGTHLATWNAAFRFSTTYASPTLSTTAGKTDYISFIYNGAASKWDCDGVNIGL